MPVIKITDQFGFSIDAQLGSTSAWAAYAKQIANLLLSGTTTPQIQNLKLSDPEIQSFNAGLTFQEPIVLENGGWQASVTVNPSAAFQIVRRTANRTLLFPSGEPGENVEIPAGGCYAVLSLTVNAGAALSEGASLSFGASAAGSLSVFSYRPFSTGEDGPTVAEALRLSVGEFVLPLSAEDLAALPAGAIVAVQANGKLKFSGNANLLAVTNPLAAVTLPASLAPLAIQQTAKVTAGASWEVVSEYLMRVHKIGGSRVRLAWYRKPESDFEIRVSASAGLNAEIGNAELLAKLMQAISTDDQPDLSEIPEEQRKAWEKAVTDAASRSLEIALEAELGALHSDEAMFLYEVDCAALDETAKAAVSLALVGDLSRLSSAPGVMELRSVQTRMSEWRCALKVNLLGILNYGSLSRLARESTVTFAPSTGDLVILDRASADRVRSAASNFGPDEERLRALMAESFLITAAYRGSKLVVTPPQLASSHVYFRLYAKARSEDLRNARAIATALGLRSPEMPAGVSDFGRITILAETHYDDQLSHALFLRPDGAPRAEAEYEAAGRRAIELLVLPDGDDRFRLLPATDDELWARMKTLGPANFEQLFPRLQAAVIRADYLAIQWWASTMCETGAILARIGTEPALREKLARHLREVAARAHEQFGKPWGLVAMFLVSGGAPAEMRVSGKNFAFSSSRALSAASPLP
jgi:hypothetical protein